MKNFFPSYEMKPNPHCPNPQCVAAQKEAQALRPNIAADQSEQETTQVIHEDNEWGITIESSYNDESSLSAASGLVYTYPQEASSSEENVATLSTDLPDVEYLAAKLKELQSQ